MREFWLDFRRGGMAEWSMAVVLKTTEPETVPGVRIPLPPPLELLVMDSLMDWPGFDPHYAS